MVLAWDEVVTTALLGTERRPLPPALLPTGTGVAGGTTVLLDHAARHRARTRAAGPLGRCPAPPCAPDDDRAWAPPAAQELLGRLLARSVPELVDVWLQAAAVRDVRPAPGSWTQLAALAATRLDLDRTLLARALGPQGVWFVAQNPAWRRLSEALAQPPPPSPPETRPAVPAELDVRGRPELALDVPAPWPRELSIAALQVLLDGQLGWRASRYGATVGARLAEADRDLLQQALDALPEPGGRGLPGLRVVQQALLAAVAAAEDRAAVDQAFDDDQAFDHDQAERPGPPANQEHP